MQEEARGTRTDWLKRLRCCVVEHVLFYGRFPAVEASEARWRADPCAHSADDDDDRDLGLLYSRGQALMFHGFGTRLPQTIVC